MSSSSRLLTLLSSLVLFISMLGGYVHPPFFSWYECPLATFFGKTLLKLQIVNFLYSFTFNNPFLTDEAVISELFTNPGLVANLLYYTPKIMIAGNVLLLLSSMLGHRLVGFFTSTALLLLIIFLSLSINVWIKNEFYPIRLSSGVFLAAGATVIAWLSNLLDRPKTC